MDVRLHERAERRIHGAMSREGLEAGEAFCYDAHVIVAATGSRAGMPRVQMAVIPDLERRRGKRSQRAAYALEAVNGNGRGAAHGACPDDFDAASARAVSQKACGSTKTILSAVSP